MNRRVVFGGTPPQVGQTGVYWSSVVDNSSNAYNWRFSGLGSNISKNSKSIDWTVRCVAR